MISVLESIYVMMDHAVCLLLLVQNCSVHFPFLIVVPTDYVYIILGNVLKPLERYLQIAVKSNATINLWCQILRIVPCRTIVRLPIIDVKMVYACSPCRFVL